MTGAKSILFVAAGLLVVAVSCTPTSAEQSIEEVFVATPDSISVPDSSLFNNIRVRLVARLGSTTAFRLDRIETSLKDTLFSFAVFAYHKEKTGEVYIVRNIVLDSTLVLVLNPPRYGKHYFKVFDSQSSFLIDSTIVY